MEDQSPEGQALPPSTSPQESAGAQSADADPLAQFNEEGDTPAESALDVAPFGALPPVAKSLPATPSPNLAVSAVTAKPQSLAVSDALAIRIQERAIRTLARLEKTRADFDAQKTRWESDQIEVDRIGDLVSALEARMQTFVGPDQPLAMGQAMVDRLEERTAEVKGRLERATAAFEGDQQRVEAGLTEIDRVSELAAALEARILNLTDRNQPLLLGQAKLDRLEARAVDAKTQLEKTTAAFDADRRRFEAWTAEATRAGEQVGALEARVQRLAGRDQPLALGQTTVERLEERTANATGQLEQLTLAFDGNKKRVDATAIEVGRMSELVTSLEARIQQIAERDQPLALGQVGQLEERATGAAAELQRTTAAFEADRERLEAGMAEVRRVSDLSAALEARLHKLTERDQPLALGQGIVSRLEERAATAKADLERVAATFDENKERFDVEAVDVGRLGDRVLVLESRIQKLADRDQPLAASEAMIGLLQQRAAETKTQLDDTAVAFKAQKRLIAAGLAEAARLDAAVSGLEKRITKLTGKKVSLERADGLVADFEQRAHDAAARLEQSGPLAPAVERARRYGVAMLAAWPDGFPLRAAITVLGGVVTGVAVGALTSVIWSHRASERDLVERGAGTTLVAGLTPVLPSTASNLPSSTAPKPPAPPTIAAKGDAPVAKPAKTPAARSKSAAAVPIAPDASPPKATKAPADSRDRKARAVEPGAPAFAGDLVVQSNPVGAQVLVDRQYVGATPIRLAKVRAGSHTVWIQLPGHQRWTAAVVVAADKLSQVTATLQPER